MWSVSGNNWRQDSKSARCAHSGQRLDLKPAGSEAAVEAPGETGKVRVFFMGVYGPGARQPLAAMARILPGLRICLTFVLGALLFCAIAIAAPNGGGKAAAGQAKDA